MINSLPLLLTRKLVVCTEPKVRCGFRASNSPPTSHNKHSSLEPWTIFAKTRLGVKNETSQLVGSISVEDKAFEGDSEI